MITLIIIVAYTIILIALLLTLMKRSYYKTLLEYLFIKKFIYPISIIAYISLAIYVGTLVLSFKTYYPWMPMTLVISGATTILITASVMTTILMGWAFAHDEFLELMAYRTQNDKGDSGVPSHAS